MKLTITSALYHGMLCEGFIYNINWHKDGGTLFGFTEIDIVEPVRFISDGELICYVKIGNYILIVDNCSAINAARLQTVKKEMVVAHECSAIDFMLYSMKVNGDL
jgi:nucleoside-triphosphatase THEP1